MKAFQIPPSLLINVMRDLAPVPSTLYVDTLSASNPGCIFMCRRRIEESAVVTTSMIGREDAREPTSVVRLIHQILQRRRAGIHTRLHVTQGGGPVCGVGIGIALVAGNAEEAQRIE